MLSYWNEHVLVFFLYNIVYLILSRRPQSDSSAYQNILTRASHSSILTMITAVDANRISRTVDQPGFITITVDIV